eukprot:gb/GEZJ01008471.1/.p1 GENE.gb/GEZJ01008471.1/~~gb/GEZJ01008471.1/.p1  ORF type:complete len:106 (+),score=2.25 gb/GEZJ01008471.1/:102-419(+)
MTHRVISKRRKTRRASIQSTPASVSECHVYLSDKEFQRAFRLTREAFNHLLAILGQRLERDAAMATRSSGGGVQPAVRLSLTLLRLACQRILSLQALPMKRPYLS